MEPTDQNSPDISPPSDTITDVFQKLTPRSHVLNALQLIIDTHLLVSVSDHAGCIIYTNDRFCEVSKYSREELIGQTHRIIKSDYHPALFNEDLWSTISSGRAWNGDIQNRAKDGSIYWVQSTISPIFDDNNQIVGYGSISTDVTAQRQLMSDLQDSERNAQTALHSAIDIIDSSMLIVDPSGKIITTNKSYSAMYPESVEAERPGNHYGLLAKHQRPNFSEDELADYIQDVITKDTTEQHVLADGRIVKIQRRIAPDGGFVSLHTDISDIVRQARLLATHTATVNLLKTIAVDANESPDTETVYSACLKRICTYTGWEVGHIYLPCNDGSGKCCPEDIWFCADNYNVTAFQEETEKTLFDPGCGLPGRVFQSGEAAWVCDVTTDANFPRAGAAKKTGIVGGAAFPVKIRNEVVAVLEFYSAQSMEPSQQLVEILSYVCDQAGRVAERERLEKTLMTRVSAELRKRDQELVEQNELFDAALKHMSQGLCMFDKEQRLIVSNDRYAQMYDLPTELLKPGITLRQILEYRIANGIYAGQNPDEYFEERQEWVTSGIYSNKVQELSNGRYMSITHQPMNGGGWLTTHEDITERTVAEKALLESQELFSKAFKASPVAIAISEPETSILVDVNETWLKMLGYDREEVLAKPTIKFGIWSSLDDRKHFVDQVWARGSVQDMDTTFFTKDGRKLNIQISGEQVDIGGEIRFLFVFHDVTERKKTEEALQESQELFTKAFHLSPVPLSFSDPADGSFHDVNGAWTNVFGYSHAEAMETSALKLGFWVNPDDRSAFLGWLKNNNEAAPGFETRIRTKCGEELDVVAHGEHVEVGGEVMLFMVFHDITASKRAEKERRESQELFSKAFKASPASMAISDPNTAMILDINEAWTNMLGFSREEALSKNVHELGIWIDPSAREHFIDLIHKEGSAKAVETRLKTKDGRTIIVVSYGEQVEVGGLPRLLFVSHDITERKLSEVALRESEQRFKDIVEVSSDWIWEWDEDLRVIFLSERFTQVSGVSMERVLGKTRYELKNEGSADWDSHIADLEARKPFRGFCYSMKDENGKMRHWIVNGQPIFDANGNFKGYRGTGADRTAEVRDQAELIRHRDHLQDLVNEATKELNNRAKDLRSALTKEKELNEVQRQFVSMASHEFRTPLSIIDSAAQRILRKVENLTPEDTTKRIEKIRGAVARMTQLMESTLDAARIEDGKINIEIEQCDLRYIILEVTMHQIELSPDHKITCNLQELPDFVMGDKGSFGQIFSNLVSNAVKYSPDVFDIQVKGRQDGDYVVVEVKDKGLGISEQDVPKMFQRFFRAETSAGIAGTGIGLNLVKTLVELHSGTIKVQSQKDAGSTFTVRLPIQGPAKIESTDGKAA